MPLRYVGLGLFTVVGFKVFFVDLASLDQFYRIIAFILLGVLVLCGSFLYLKYRQTFESQHSEVAGEVKHELSHVHDPGRVRARFPGLGGARGPSRRSAFARTSTGGARPARRSWPRSSTPTSTRRPARDTPTCGSMTRPAPRSRTCWSKPASG